MSTAPTTATLLRRGEHWALYDKPAGMTVVGGRGVPRPTLLDVAIEQLGNAKPVHRLDKPTTGCTLVATTTFGQQALSDAFRRRLIDKRYVAIVEGVPTWKTLVVDARLARIDDPDLPRIGGKKAPLSIQTIDENGERALTRLRVLAVGEGVALVEARPETGRMHQIRCHLAHVGFPIAGDRLYGATSTFVDDQELALHAWGVSFPRPEGGRGAGTAPVPSSWWAWAATRRLGLGALTEAMSAFEKQMTSPAPTKPSAPPSKPSSSSRPSSPASKPSSAPAKPAGRGGAPKRVRPPSSSTPPGPPRSRPGAAGARSGPSRRGGPPGR
jgi:tRNA pseudouridine32 synthase/23S rRNA pseudouridine746 synthase